MSTTIWPHRPVLAALSVAAMAAAAFDYAPVAHSQVPILPTVREDHIPKRRKMKRRDRKRLERRQMHEQRWRNWRQRRTTDVVRANFQAMVNRLTNWQRSRWAAAGYPGLHGTVAGSVEPFSTLRRTKR